jgi:hypothetical protein
MWGTGGTLPRTAGSFLMPGFPASTGHFTARLGIVRAKAGIGHLALECLVHQVNFYRGFKDRSG